MDITASSVVVSTEICVLVKAVCWVVRNPFKIVLLSPTNWVVDMDATCVEVKLCTCATVNVLAAVLVMALTCVLLNATKSVLVKAFSMVLVRLLI